MLTTCCQEPSDTTIPRRIAACPPKEKLMNFVSLRIITADIKRLTRFYEQIAGIPVKMFTEDFGELKTPACTLAIGSTRTLQLFGRDVARPADNHTAIIEFRVDDVDAEHQRLKGMIGDSLVQEPTTMPWGNRSLLFRDPDGSLVNFFTPVSAEAIKKFGPAVAGP
jgi:predicted enzyme related to lactoylglutathione lyase